MGKSENTIIEVEGSFWWLGEEIPEGRSVPSTALSGTLTISGNGLAKLTVTGSLMSSPPVGLDTKGRFAAINDVQVLQDRTIAGRGERFQTIFLRNIVARIAGHRSENGIEVFEAGFSLVGHNNDRQQRSELAFSRLSIELRGLEQWSWNDRIIVNDVVPDQAENSQMVRWAAQTVGYPVEAGQIRFRTNIHCDRLPGVQHREISFRQHDWIDYLPDSPLSPDQLKQEFGYIEEFLSLLFGTYYYLDWPQLANGTDASLDESYTLYFWRHKEDMKPLERYELWTIFPQIEKTFGSMYVAARGKRKEYGPAFYLRLGALRSSSMYIEHRFINFIWGIESLHRAMRPNANGSSREIEMIEHFMEKLRDVLTANSRARKWFQRALKMAHEPQLKDRIIEIFSKLPWAIESKSLGVFAQRCADRRNDLSHYGGPRQYREASNEAFLQDLQSLNEALSVLYHGALLQEIGLNDEILRQALLHPLTGNRIRWALEHAGLTIASHLQDDGSSPR